jgi:two-component system sensor histidine kinase KdpD
MNRPGTLRIYLGAAPGVGKTYAMLAEAHRRRDRGTDVVVGFVEAHGRPLTAMMAEGLETVPRRRVTYRGAEFSELDVPAVLARRPQVALVDELAHSNADDSGHAKRWQDVDDLLAAGIDVISTLNIQHLESLNEVVTEITGVVQRETIPDAVARRADQIELVDMSPEALRRRMVHGNIYPTDRIDAALTHYFRPGNLSALRELALLWMADRTEEVLRKYREAHDIVAPWETRERVVVGLSGAPREEALVRRAARITQRIPGAELLAVHVVSQDGLARTDPETLEHLDTLAAGLAGTFHRVTGDDVAEALARFARENQATQLVLGAHVSAHGAPLHTGVAWRVLRDCEGVDVHLVRVGPARGHGFGRLHTPHTTRRRAVDAEAAVVRALADCVLEGGQDLPSLLEYLRRCLGLRSVAVLEAGQAADGTRWRVVSSAGEHCPESPDDADAAVPWDEKATLVAAGPGIDAATRAALAASAVHIRDVLARAAARHAELEQRRHTVRTTLSTIQLVLEHELAPQIEAALESLPDAADTRAAAKILESAARHTADLDDLCRVDTGGLDVQLRPVELDDVLDAALDDLGPGGRRLDVDLPETAPDAIADADALSRALTVLIADALRRGDQQHAPELTVRGTDGRVHLAVHGHATARHPESTQPVARSLALRLARGLIEAMTGTVTLEGGAAEAEDYTVVIDLPAARISAGG